MKPINYCFVWEPFLQIKLNWTKLNHTLENMNQYQPRTPIRLHDFRNISTIIDWNIPCITQTFTRLPQQQHFLQCTYYKNDPRDQLFRNQDKYFALRILSRSRHNFVLIYFFVNKYVYRLHNMPDKRRLVTSNICFGSEIAGL